MTSFYTQKMVFTKSKNFDEGEGEDYFLLIHTAVQKYKRVCGSATARTGGKSGVYDFLK